MTQTTTSPAIAGATTAAEPMIEAIGLSKFYGSFAASRGM